MRYTVLLAAALLTTAPLAAQAGDRFSPFALRGTVGAAEPAPDQPQRAPTYDGPLLTWARKAPQTTLATAPAAAPTRPEPTAFGAQYQRGAARAPIAQAAPAPASQTFQSPPLRGFQPQAPLAHQQQAFIPLAGDPLPDSLYGGPPAPAAAPPAVAQPRAEAEPRPQPQPQPPARAAMEPAPAPVAMPAARPRQLADASAAAQGGTGGVRLYSLHRGYGLTPDVIPEPPAGNRYVLIGPGDAPAAAGGEAKDGEGEDAPRGAPF